MQKGRAAGAWQGAAWALGAGLFAACVAAGTVNSQAQGGAERSILETYRNKNRVLLVFAPGRDDARCQRQSALIDGKTAGLNERDLILLYVLADGKSYRIGTRLFGGGDEDALRHRFGVTSAQFKVALIGKDGHTAYTADHPISSGQLFGLIDAMPMRREEMRRQGHKAGGADTKDTKALAAQNATGKTNVPTPGKPNKNMTPAQVVRTQMEALQHNDTPHPDAGIETTFAFASPQNKLATGPLEHFIGIVKDPAYLPMLNCKSVTYDPVAIDGDSAQQRVHIVAPDGARIVYLFTLSRQADGPFAGCWMNDGCIREESEPARDTSRDA